MKKILVLFLVLFLPLTAFAQEPLSQEVLDQAKLQAGLFLELKNALGLAWMDDYNAYLEDPVNSPQPAWATSVQDLINDSYLSGTFPTDFVITPTGQEVKISRTITLQAIKDVLPIYLPSVAIAGNTVSLLVQRPEQWVAWEAGLLGKVSRDGSDNPDILPNSVLDFGKSSEIKFVNNDGKITGVNSLIYKTQELDSRFINVSGDNMTGDLTIKGNKAWHAGNDGTGSGLDADLLDGQDGSYYLAAENLTGIVPPEKLDGTYNINISGKASTATYASDSDKLDGYDSSHFATVGHTHSYVSIGGDTMKGTLVLPNLEVQSGGSVKFYSESGASTISTDQSGNLNLQANKVTVPSKMDVGGLKITDIYAQDVFGWKSSVDLSGSNVGIRVPDQNILLGFNDKGGITVVDTTNGAPLMELDRSGQLYVNRNKVWHAGNDGSGSGLDADLLDGLDSTDFLRAQALRGQVDLNNIKTAGVYVLGYWGDAMASKNLPVNSEFTLLVVGHPHHFVSQLFFPVPTGRTSIIFVRSYYAWEGTWTNWHAINSDGTISPYIPGNNVICDLSANPIDISALLSARTQTSYKTTTDETGTYKMWKYKQTIGPSSDIFDIIRPQYMNVIKSRTGLNTIASIKVRFKVTPKVNGNILAAGAVVTRRQPHVAVRYIYAGYDFYNSIVEAIDMVGKTQNTESIDETGGVELVELYTMKSNYVYGNVNITAESVAKAEIVTVWGTR